MSHCPICETKILDSSLAKCQQCNSDLDVFRVLERTQERREKTMNIPSFEVSKEQKQLNGVKQGNPFGKVKSSSGIMTKMSREYSVLQWLLLLLFFSLFLLFVFKTQLTILSELKQERSSRLVMEERQSKITDKLMEKIIELYNASLNSLAQTNKEQQEIIQKMNDRIHELSQKETVLKQR